MGIRIWDAANQGEPHSLNYFATWREDLDCVEDLGAFRTLGRNLIGPDESPSSSPSPGVSRVTGAILLPEWHGMRRCGVMLAMDKTHRSTVTVGPQGRLVIPFRDPAKDGNQPG